MVLAFGNNLNLNLTFISTIFFLDFKPQIMFSWKICNLEEDGVAILRNVSILAFHIQLFLFFLYTTPKSESLKKALATWRWSWSNILQTSKFNYAANRHLCCHAKPAKLLTPQKSQAATMPTSTFDVLLQNKSSFQAPTAAASKLLSQ